MCRYGLYIRVLGVRIRYAQFTLLAVASQSESHGSYVPTCDRRSECIQYYMVSTRGNNYKHLKRAFHYDLRQQFFSVACIVNIWNNLPNSVVNASAS